jgi:hypothetical protein
MVRERRQPVTQTNSKVAQSLSHSHPRIPNHIGRMTKSRNLIKFKPLADVNAAYSFKKVTVSSTPHIFSSSRYGSGKEAANHANTNQASPCAGCSLVINCKPTTAMSAVNIHADYNHSSTYTMPVALMQSKPTRKKNQRT